MKKLIESIIVASFAYSILIICKHFGNFEHAVLTGIAIIYGTIPRE